MRFGVFYQTFLFLCEETNPHTSEGLNRAALDAFGYGTGHGWRISRDDVFAICSPFLSVCSPYS